ncbi:MAG: WbqC family protein [Planctomycetota bacterium]|nr:WbqC family protein [Planctomycetota bacterium]
MRVTGHQPNYLPYIGFFHKIATADVYVIVDNTQFVKRGPFGWIHRNRIRTDAPEGWSWLTVPVLTKGKFSQSIGETKIDNGLAWQRKHLKSIEWHYRKAPYFDLYMRFFRSILEKKWETLSDLTTTLIRGIIDLLDLQVKVLVGSELGITGKGTGLVVDLCRKTGATTYVSGMHGRDYLDESAFAAAGVRLEYQQFAHPVYRQVYADKFVPNLSILDLLMNEGPGSRTTMLTPATALSPGMAGEEKQDTCMVDDQDP